MEKTKQVEKRLVALRQERNKFHNQYFKRIKDDKSPESLSDYMSEWDDSKSTRGGGFIRPKDLMKPKKQKEYMKRCKEMACLDLLKYQAEDNGLPQSAGADIVIEITGDELKKLWNVRDGGKIYRVLKWLENHRWIVGERKGTRRAGKYILGTVLREQYKDGKRICYRKASWMSGEMLPENDSE